MSSLKDLSCAPGSDNFEHFWRTVSDTAKLFEIHEMENIDLVSIKCCFVCVLYQYITNTYFYSHVNFGREFQVPERW